MSKRKNNKGFTLIELIAVLVILAILALIVTPLVLNIVRSAKDSANKRSVDAYGKAVELSIATYLLDNGDFPTSINDLTVEYTGSEVVCKVQKLNEDSSVYLSECTVGNSEVKDSSTDDGWYHYGENKSKYDYKIGDQVTYNGMDFYVIANSEKGSDSVTLLKAEPLTYNELVSLKEKTELKNSIFDVNGNGYGGLSYSAIESCGYINGTWGTQGCTNDYDSSSIIQILRAWSDSNLNSSDLKEDSTGYKVRLIILDELTDNLGYIVNAGDTWYSPSVENTPEWVYEYNYLTMSPNEDFNDSVWYVNTDGKVHSFTVYSSDGVVRPVVTLLKSAIK